MSESKAEYFLECLEDGSCDLRCVDVPTGADDCEIEWVVIEHYMSEPTEREMGRGSTAMAALNDAFGV